MTRLCRVERRGSCLLALACILVLATVIRFYHLGHESLWLDEAISYQRSNLPVRDLVAESIRAFHNPTYFLILRAFLTFGDSEFFLRLPSVLFGIGKVALVYRIGRSVGGSRAGLLSALVVAVSQSQIHYDQEARMYAPQLWAISVASLGLVSVLQVADAPPSERRARWPWVLFVLGSVFALYLHNTSVLFLMACSTALGVASLGDVGFAKSMVKWWASAHAAIVVLYLPYAGTLFSQADSLSDKGYGRSLPRFEQALETLQGVYALGQGTAIIGITSILCACAGAWGLRKQRRILSCLITLSLGGPVLVGLATCWEPMFLLRLMLWSALPYAVLVGVGMAELLPRRLLPWFALVFTVVSCHALHRDYFTVWQKPNWRGAIHYLAEHQSEGDIVLAIGEREERFLNYYWKRKNGPLPRFSVTWDLPEMQRNLGSLIAQKTTVWTLRGRTFDGGNQVRRELKMTRRRVLEREFGPRLVVEKYERNAKR